MKNDAFTIDSTHEGKVTVPIPLLLYFIVIGQLQNNLQSLNVQHPWYGTENEIILFLPRELVQVERA